MGSGIKQSGGMVSLRQPVFHFYKNQSSSNNNNRSSNNSNNSRNDNRRLYSSHYNIGVPRHQAVVMDNLFQGKKGSTIPSVASRGVSGLSSIRNSLEVSMCGSYYSNVQDPLQDPPRPQQREQQQKQQQKQQRERRRRQQQRQRQHYGGNKRARFGAENSLESWIADIFSCGCVHGGTVGMVPEKPGFASKPLAPDLENQDPAPFHLPPPPEIRRLSLKDVNDPDITFMVY